MDRRYCQVLQYISPNKLQELGCNGNIDDLEMLRICGRTEKSLLATDIWWTNGTWTETTGVQVGILRKACPAIDINSSAGTGTYR